LIESGGKRGARSATTTFYIKGRFLIQQYTGVQRLAAEMVGALDRLAGCEQWPAGVRFVVLAPPGAVAPPEWKHIATKVVGRTTGHLWEQVELPWAARDGHLISFAGPPVLCKQQQIPFIADAVLFDAPQGYTRVFASWYRITCRAAAWKGLPICTISEFSRQRLAAALNLVPGKLKVIYCGADHIDRMVEDDRIFERHPFLLDEPYVLAVGSLAPNKNLKVVAEAAKRLQKDGVRFVLAGKSASHVFGSSGEDLQNIVHPGFVTDGELKALYRHAACFVFPSLYEGFGIPAVEAMSCSCPVVASNAASLPEVCGDAALFFDPRSVEELCAQLEKLLASRSLQEQLRSAGRCRVGRFTWESSGREFLKTVDTYLEML
jgi:glycosyltransferase involved in cell wall biosynthesis